MAVAGDISGPGGDFENQILWSTAADPGAVPSSWSAAPDNSAGDNILAATPGSVVDGVPLKDNMYLLKNHSIYIMSLVGGQFIFSFRKFAVTIGALTRNCAIEYKGNLYIFTDGDIVRTDGHTIESIAERRVRKTVFNEMDATFFYTSYMAIWSEEDELWFCYPTTGSPIPNKAAVYNLVSGDWGFRELNNIAYSGRGLINDLGPPLSWDEQTDTWNESVTIWNAPNTSAIADSIVMADETNKLFFALGELDPIDPIPIEGSVSKLSIPLGDDHESVKYISEVWPLVSGQPGGKFNVRLGSQFHENDAIDWAPIAEFQLGTDDKLDVDLTGRYFSIEYSGTGFGTRTGRFLGFEVRYQKQGRF